jgi:hypothetical protein
MGKEKLFSKDENREYYSQIFSLNLNAFLDPTTQWTLALSGRVNEMALARAEDLKTERMREIEKRKSIIEG